MPTNFVQFLPDATLLHGQLSLLRESRGAELVGGSVGSRDENGAVRNEERQKTFEHDGCAEIGVLDLVETKQPGKGGRRGCEDGDGKGRWWRGVKD